MKAITFPFKTERDRQAFHTMLSMLSPEDRDTLIEVHNRRDPQTGYISAQDVDTNRRLTEKLIGRVITEGITDEMREFYREDEIA